MQKGTDDYYKEEIVEVDFHCKSCKGHYTRCFDSPIASIQCKCGSLDTLILKQVIISV